MMWEETVSPGCTRAVIRMMGFKGRGDGREENR